MTELTFIPPMLPTLAAHPPDGNGWLHEIKHDGYRTQITIRAGSVRAFTRRGLDWSDRYKTIIRAAGDLPCKSAILDGEMIVQDEEGRSDFQSFKGAFGNEPERLVFMAFDLLHRDGEDLRSAPLIQRRHELQELIGSHDSDRPIHYSDHAIGGGGAMFSMCDRMGLEGIVSKKLNSPYRSGRSKKWLKIKCWAEGQFVVVGVEATEDGPSVALLARETSAGLEYAGPALVTLSDEERERFWRTIGTLKSDEPAAEVRSRRGAQWVRPRLRVRAKYLRGEDPLRHATLSSLEGTA